MPAPFNRPVTIVSTDITQLEGYLRQAAESLNRRHPDSYGPLGAFKKLAASKKKARIQDVLLRPGARRAITAHPR